MNDIIKILKNYKDLGKRFYYILFVVLSFGSLMLLFPKLIEKIIGVIEQGGTYDELLFWGVFGAGFILVINVFWYLDDIVKADMRERLFFKRSQHIRKKIVEKDIKDILEQGTGKLMSRVSRGTNAEVEIFEATLQIITEVCFRTIIVLMIISLYYPALLWLVVLSTIILFSLNVYFIKKINELSAQENVLFEQGDRVLVRMINENLIIKLFGKKNVELAKSHAVLSKIPGIAGKRAGIYSLSYVALFTCIRGIELFAYIYIGNKILEGGSSIAELVLLISYIALMWRPLEKAADEVNRITKNMQAYRRLQTFIDTPNDIVNGEEEYEYKKGVIEFKNIDFGYSPEVQIFENLNLQLLPGKKNALIGNSGGGKSTIMKLVMRLYDIQGGQVLIDGQDVKNLDIESLYKEVGYLSQDPSMFDGTIRENMEYAFDTPSSVPPHSGGESQLVKDEGVSRDELIWEALEKSQIADMVRKLEKGLDTEIGEKGIKLSGGEKQRLAIARVFLKNPKIIILDEPTSALDNKTEKYIQESLDELMKGKTSIIIAHRLTTIQNADKIFMLEDGKIIESGNYDELMKKKGKFHELASPEHMVVH